MMVDPPSVTALTPEAQKADASEARSQGASGREAV